RCRRARIQRRSTDRATCTATAPTTKPTTTAARWCTSSRIPTAKSRRLSRAVSLSHGGEARYRRIAWGLLAAILCLLSPAIASAADVAHNDSLLIAPQVDGKPVQVSVGLFLTNLIDVDEVKELFQISGYLFMTWKDPRLAFSPRPGATQREYTPDEIWIPSLLMINATAAREKVTANIKGDADGTIHYIELFQAELT